MIEKLQTRICTSCQAETDADAIFCSECGAMQTIKSENINKSSCPNCHKAAAPTDKFCRFCAFNLSENESAPARNGKPILGKENLLEIDNVSDLLVDSKNAPEKPKMPETIQAHPFEENSEFLENKPKSQEKSLSTSLVSAAMKRYADGYRVARALNGFGATLKAIGLIGGVGFILLGLLLGQIAATQVSRSTFGLTDGAGLMMSSIISFGITGAIFALIFWILGIWISAQGQVLKAHLDSAVYSSPFLSVMDKARVMSLPVDGTAQNIFVDELDLNKPKTSLQLNVKASLAYGLCLIPTWGILWLTVPIYFLMTTPKENQFLRLHSFQSIILNTSIFIISLIGTLSETLAIYYIAWFIAVIVNLFCIWGAYNNGKSKLPIIGDIAKNLSENTIGRSA